MSILSNLAYQPIAFDVPSGHSREAKAVNSGIMLWDANNQRYTLDPTQNNQLLEVQNIQSVFVDNYNTTGITVITVATTGHVIRIPPKAQAFMPLICGDRPVLQIDNVSNNGSSQLWLLNIPALGVLWTLP